MLNTVTSRNILPHTPINNQQTHFDSARLLKGDPPGRHLVNYYTSELGILKNSKQFSDHCIDNHLRDINEGLYTQVKEYTSAIRFKNPQRHVPYNI